MPDVDRKILSCLNVTLKNGILEKTRVEMAVVDLTWWCDGSRRTWVHFQEKKSIRRLVRGMSRSHGDVMIPIPTPQAWKSRRSQSWVRQRSEFCLTSSGPAEALVVTVEMKTIQYTPSSFYTKVGSTWQLSKYGSLYVLSIAFDVLLGIKYRK